MKIWVDADGCPVVIREILYRAAVWTGVKVTFVANQPIRVPASSLIEFLPVDPGFDVADSEIVKRAGRGDLVVTADIPLAAEVMGNGAHALSPRGELMCYKTGQFYLLPTALARVTCSWVEYGRTIVIWPP